MIGKNNELSFSVMVVFHGGVGRMRVAAAAAHSSDGGEPVDQLLQWSQLLLLDQIKFLKRKNKRIGIK